MQKSKYIFVLSIILLAIQSGCAIKSNNIADSDPWINWNKKVQYFNDTLDEYALKPIAKGYRLAMPQFANRAISNVFNNIDDINVIVNDSLQGKFTQSAMDTARFLINSTVGIAGLIDIATMLDLPKHNEDFGQTLGVWGVPSGNYMVLPLLGPSSPRGIAGLLGKIVTNPIAYVGIYISGSSFVLDNIDLRSNKLGTEKIVTEASVFGRYELFRDAYLAKRKALITNEVNIEYDDSFILDENFE